MTLISRLEAATEGSRELDAEILRIAKPEFADMQLHPNAPGWIMGGDHKQPECAPDYTTSIDAALTLVPDGWYWQISHYDLPTAVLGPRQAPDHELVEAATPALALCIAALKARSAP